MDFEDFSQNKDIDHSRIDTNVKNKTFLITYPIKTKSIDGWM